MNVFLAMLIDSYRELNSKKLFWITICISGMVVLSYGSIGFNEQGMSMLFGLKQIDSEFINSTSPWSRALYLGIFSDFVVTIWLSWVAVILALISTCSIFPDFMAGGAIELTLSKPISRVRLFIIKYVTSLLFVVLQVALFCAGVFLCVGIRIGEWNWMIFAAIPVVAVFYSYLYAVCVLAGVLTRSPITALLLTLLFWFSTWSIQTSEGTLQQFRLRFEVQAEYAETRMDQFEKRLVQLDTEDNEGSVSAAQSREKYTERLEEAREERDSALDGEASLARWHGPIKVVMAVLPKNALTVGLLSRWLKDPEGFSITAMMRGEMSGAGTTALVPDPIDSEMIKRLEVVIDSYSVWYIIGTSLMFEAAVLSLACFFFVRRDY